MGYLTPDIALLVIILACISGAGYAALLAAALYMVCMYLFAEH